MIRACLLIGCACTMLSCGTSSPADAADFSGSGGTAEAGGAAGVGGTVATGAGGILAGSGGDPGTGGSAPGSGGTRSEGTGGATFDPSVTFDWPEAPPPAGKCEAGTYAGTFTCDVTFLPGFPPGQVAGPLTFTLTPSAVGEFLEIDKGRMDANAVGTPFGADLSGKLDCSTRVFHADTLNGTYGTAPFLGQFFGTLDGKLDGLTNTLAGTWALSGGTMAMPTGISCKGSWSSVNK